MSGMPSDDAAGPGRPLPLPRRGFLRVLGGAGLGVTALGAALSACSAQDLIPVPLPRAADLSRTQPVVQFANWSEYVDTVPGNPPRYPTLEEFTRQTGIVVDYSEPITADEQFVGEIGISLAMGWAPGYDLVVLADWAVAELIQLGWAQPLSPALLRNGSRLLPQFRDWPVPDVRRYSLPWQCGFTGIVYNLAVTHRPVTSMNDLLTSPDLHGKVSLPTNYQDVMALVMLGIGIDPATFTDREFGAALAVLSRAVQAGQITMVTNYYGPDLLKGTIAAGVGWAGDVLYFRQQNPDIYFTWPQGGGHIWSDNMVIPARARHGENAEWLMNFYYEPDIAAQLSKYERYMCPVLGTQEAMRRLDPGLADEKYIFPTPGLLDSGHFFKILTPQQNSGYTARYQSIVGL
jgi:spermidine/putrescine transport system substrate-binding protein